MTNSSVKASHIPFICLNFPRFKGDDPDGWCTRAFHFFDYYNLSDQERFTITGIHMQGTTLTWFQALQASDGLSTWFEFLQAQFSIPETIEDLEKNQDNKKDSSCRGGENREKIKKRDEECDRK
jgi:hypothetical protein